MQPPIGLLTPVKASIGGWLSQFHAQYQPDTLAATEWAGRSAAKAMSWAPARMVDQVEMMLSSWRRGDHSGATGTSAALPALFAATASDYTESPGESGRPLADDFPISFPDDTLKRSFRVRLLNVDLRAQVVAVAPDSGSAMSIIGQLGLWCVQRRRTHARFHFNGFATDWPVLVLPADRLAIPTPLGEQLSILTLDLTLRATMPLFIGPRGAEPTDGNVPPGFPLVRVVTNQHNLTLGPPSFVCQEEWDHYASLMSQSEGRPRLILGSIKD